MSNLPVKITEDVYKLDPDIYTLIQGRHKNNDVIWIKFPYNLAHLNSLKKMIHVKWSATKKCWYAQLPPNSSAISPPNTNCNELLPSKTKLNIKNEDWLNRMQETLVLKAYSPNTIRTYMNEFYQLLKAIKDYPVNELTKEQLRSYFLYCIYKLKCSENHVHSRINAVKFFFEQVLHQPKMFIDIPRPKKKVALPKVLSTCEIKRLFQVTQNLKHRLMLQLCYGMGLRVSEITNLRITDIDSKRMQVLIHAAKGKKDRYLNLPKSILDDLRNYYLAYKPKHYLFEGENGQYAIRSVQAVFKQAMQKARIKKQIGIHGLRHSYATHLLEYGTDVTVIQKLLGHQDLKTTQIYAKVSNNILDKVKSPLDQL